MNSIFAPPVAVARQANRAIGAMFFCVFGGVWFTLWAHWALVAPLTTYVLIAVATVVFFWLVLRIYRLHAAALSTEPPDERRRRSRGFHLVNVAQWVLLVIVANVFANTGRSSWIVPAAIFVIGAHFMPLARVFRYPPHYITGAAMMLVAVLYPVLASAGPSSPIGCLGAGIILWVSAGWAITGTGSQQHAA